MFTGDYTKFRLQGPYLILAKSIDVDTEPSMWSLTVKVRDRGEPRLSAEVNIVVYVDGVDDNGPVWAAPENGKYVIGQFVLACPDLINQMYEYIEVMSTKPSSTLCKIQE